SGSINIEKTLRAQNPHHRIETRWRYMLGHPFKLTVKKGEQTFTLHQVTDMQDFAAHLGIPLWYPPDDSNRTTPRDSSRKGVPRSSTTRMQPKRKSPPASQELTQTDT
ncbi:Hypothetical predicted protein, partial [Pelobates cultripes]